MNSVVFEKGMGNFNLEFQFKNIRDLLRHYRENFFWVLGLLRDVIN